MGPLPLWGLIVLAFLVACVLWIGLGVVLGKLLERNARHYPIVKGGER